MNLLIVAFLLLFQTEALSAKSIRSHFADNLKLKCDSLPYRTAFDGNRCYFAIFRKATYLDAQIDCLTTLQGAQVAVEVPSSILTTFMVNQSLFHSDSGTEAKHTLCVRDSAYKCDKGQINIRGKCISRADKKMNFADAQKNCKKAGMELFSPSNDLDNQIVLNQQMRDAAWVQKSLTKRGSNFVWSFENNYARFGICDGKAKKPSLYAGSQTGCNAPVAAVIDKTGYWSNADQKYELEVICTKNAGNEMTPVIIKKEFIQKNEPCVEEHEMDESTGKCEWTGPIDACVKLVDYWNDTYFVPMPEYPMYSHVEVDIGQESMNDYAVKVVVRRGCMFTGYAQPLNGNALQEVKIAENLVYGAHKLPNYMTRELRISSDGLTRVNCYCDPTEATVNEHTPAPPPHQKCIEHHVYNETTEQCEWVHDPKFCGEVITNDNRRMRLEIPGWPDKKKYDVDHFQTRKGVNFHFAVTQIIVRQHCFATLYYGGLYDWKTLPTQGYGLHTVATSFATPPLAASGVGTRRFVCECIK